VHQKIYLQCCINQIQASDWQAAGIPYVVTGQIKQTADRFEVHYQLYDVQKQQYLLNEF
jgi:TolB protein